MPNVFHFPPDKLADLIWKSEQAGDTWHSPLYRAAREGNLNLLMVPPGERAPVSLLDPVKHRKPLVVILCGDPGDAAIHHGPDAFPQTIRFMRWARFIMLHGAGGEPVHYRMLAQAAAFTGRTLVVETDGVTLPAWMAFKARLAPQTPGIIVKPHPGVEHPRSRMPAGVVAQ